MSAVSLDRFDYASYGRLMDRLRATHRAVRFRDLLDGPPPERFFLLRHDVDYVPADALRLAELEASQGLAASYFLLVNTFHYNLLDPVNADLARRLVALGHEVGLHYDARFFRAFPEEEWPQLLEQEALLLGLLAGMPIVSIAMHQPGTVGADPFRSRTRFLNAYDDRFFRDMPYYSDSCRAFRDEAHRVLTNGALPPRFQLALHPINWADGDRDRVAIFREAHAGIAARVVREGEALLENIARHPAVHDEDRRRVEKKA